MRVEISPSSPRSRRFRQRELEHERKMLERKKGKFRAFPSARNVENSSRRGGFVSKSLSLAEPFPPSPSCRELNFYSCANDAAIFRSLKWALKLSGQFGREDVLLFSNQRKGLLHLHPSFVSVLMNPSSNVTSFLQRGGHRYCRILTRPNNNSPSTRSLASRPILHVVEGEEKRKKKKKKNREPIPP